MKKRWRNESAHSRLQHGGVGLCIVTSLVTPCILELTLMYIWSYFVCKIQCEIVSVGSIWFGCFVLEKAGRVDVDYWIEQKKRPLQ